MSRARATSRWGVGKSDLLKDPERLRAGLEETIEEERKGLRGDPERETKAWLEKLAETDRKRSGFQDMAVEGLITFDELRAKLAALEETRETAQRELEAFDKRREKIEELEHDRDALLESYASLVPEALDALTPEERHRIYKMLRLNVIMYADGLVEIAGAFTGLLEANRSNSVKTESTSSSTATSRTSRCRAPGPTSAWR